MCKITADANVCAMRKIYLIDSFLNDDDWMMQKICK